MKTLNFEEREDFFAEYALSIEEMINVRGGADHGIPTVLPPLPPIRI